MKRFFSKIINARNISIFFLALEIILIVLGIILLTDHFAEIKTILSLLAIVVALIIFHSKCNSSYKIAWLLLMIFLPIFGSTFYLLFANKKFSKRELKKMMPIAKAMDLYTQDKRTRNIAEKIDKNKDPEAAFFAKYLYEYALSGTFENTEVTYYPWGQDAWKIMLEKMESAKHYIFMEYFIVQDGIMWLTMLDILKRKAREGVEVRFMYDDLGCISTLPPKYYKYLETFGIKAKACSPIKPIVDIRMNNRDHRKIMVIDGYIGFTGGINLADEYINKHERFGLWKDNAIMLRGDGVFGLLSLFLSHWAVERNEFDEKMLDRYLVDTYSHEDKKPRKTSGYVIPYGSLPYTYETVGENVYLDIILKAKRYIYITTPYLILDEQLNNALMNAAKGGIKIKLLTPHIPDKKLVFDLTRSYYKDLIEAGVEVYEYTPGFVHAKTFLVDGEYATVGTINLDFRSLYLHMENGCFLYKCDCIKDIENDMKETFAQSDQITKEMLKQIPFYKKALRFFLRFFASAL